MDQYTDQSSSNLPILSDELQLAVVKQQNTRLTQEILPFTVKHYLHQDELNMLLNTTRQLKYNYFAVEQQPYFFTRKGITGFTNRLFSYIVEIYGAQLTKGSVLFICDPLTNFGNQFLVCKINYN